MRWKCVADCNYTLSEAISGGGSRASASALTSGMPLVGGESPMSSSFSPMLASDMDLGRAVALKGVPDITSAPQHNRLLDVCNYARHN